MPSFSHQLSACCSLEHVISVGNYGRGRSPGRLSGEVELENTELQLLQVSKGAQNLKEMIDSWSKAPNANKRSKDVARDLLRSAIDLQESLSMLAKLQDASKHMSKVKRNKAANEVEFEEISSSRRFSIDGSFHRLQEPRHSVDGSSKGCVEELRKIIGDSLFRQNLLSRPSEDEMAQSSRSLRFNPDDEFKGPFLQTKKVKQPNLIAKLMGLDEVPCDAIQREDAKNMSSMKLPQKHPILDTEILKMRKAQVPRENTDQRKRTLQDIIERSQLKGFLRNGQVEDTSNSSMVSKLSVSKRYDECFNEDDEVPPIVIVKPAKLSNREKRDDKREEPQVQKADTKSAQSIKEEKVLSKGRVLSDKAARKEATSIEKTKTEFVLKVKELDANKQKQNKEAFTNNKMFDDWQKPSLTTKKLEMKNDIKVIKTAKSPAKTSKTSSKSEENVTTAVAKNYHLSSQAIRQQKHSLNSPPKHIVDNSISSLKERKKTAANPVKTSTTTTTTAIKAAHFSKKNRKKRKEDGKEVKRLHKTDIILPADDQKACSKDDKTEYEENHCEAKQNLITETAEAIHVPKKNKPISNDMKCILLTNQSFFMQAQELINSKHQPIFRRKSIESVDTTNAKLFLDCANEVMSRKRLQNELSRHPMLQACIWSPTLYHSLDHLLQEISNEFEKLTSYNSTDHSATAEDYDLYVRLEKDLRNKDMLIDSMWDVGWLNLCCVEEVDEVVGSVEKEIIDWLIEELAWEVL
ncbi:hypothetical protein IHE45_17G079800 [Dioscorea alata]|uniref:Uncharacterized protein n=1 Tax=Dioscorea alata TaxID=55571 RepID=A0ACB7UDG8_DIOAL|nr:hypothetical protein IHE45_17G079800 [Dioscorea alata]